MARYSSTAVNALQSVINSNIAAKLTTVESENSLSDGTIPRPEAVLKRYAPFDQRVPLIQVFEERAEPHEGSGGQRSGEWDVQCKVVLQYKSDADLDTHEVRFRLYVEALIRVLLADDTLGGLVTATILRSVDFMQDAVNDSTTLHTVALDLLVFVESTRGG